MWIQLRPWVRTIGSRYLRSKRQNGFLSFITVLSVLGIGIGVAALITVLSIMDGFESELKKRLMGSEIHILVEPGVEQSQWTEGQIEQFKKQFPQIRDIDPVLADELMLRSGRKVKGVVVKGVGPEKLARLKNSVVEWVDPKLIQSDLPGVFVGQELAIEMRLIPGDGVTLVSPTEMEGPLANAPRTLRAQVEGVYRTGLADQELHTVFAPVAMNRRFLKRASGFSSWEVSVYSFELAPRIADALSKEQPNLTVRDWRQLNSHLFASLKLERLAMFVVLGFIVIVASFNIITTLTLMVLEKVKEISILRAMGARSGQVAGVFLWEGLLIGSLGVGGGAAAGVLACLFLARYPVIELPDVFYDRSLPVTFDVGYYLAVVMSAFLIVLIACIYPSWRASRIHPLDGIRSG